MKRSTIRITLLAVDKRRDIALLLVDGVNLPYLKIGRSESAQIGDKLFTLGSPLGFLQNTLSEGLLSGICQGAAARKRTLVLI
jgi:serine protease Do